MGTLSAAAARGVIMIAGALTFVGCASGPTPRETLSGGFKELDAAAPNYATMSAAADTYIEKEPKGTALADAFYLRGRALEEKAGHDPSAPQKDAVDAYNAYAEALNHKPGPGLEGLIHTGMGNVLYFQERYSAAANELTAGYDKLERDTDKAWALYRIGLCNQRMAKWDDADKFFAAVQQQYPGSAPAQRAREHQGYKAFWVQIATFASPATAAAAADDLKKQGLTAQLFVDTTRNAQVVRVGPLGTYDAATATKQRVSGKWRDSIIVP
jgi:tetratricopeptide (TPR) repeat protein